MHGGELEPRHHALHQQAIDHRAHERDQRARIARGHGAVGDPALDALGDRAAMRLEHAVAHVDELAHALA